MGLKIQPTRRIGSKITTLIAVFALVVQPMYGLVAERVANAAVGDPVCISGGDCYSTIQSAINAAGSGATITVASGTYNESVVIDKPITLRGAQAGVDARPLAGSMRDVNGSSETVVSALKSQKVFTIAADEVTIDGLVVRQTSGSGQSDAIKASNSQSNITIVNTIVVDATDEAIQLEAGVNYNVSQNHILNPVGDGITFSTYSPFKGTNLAITNNEITGSTSAAGSIYLYGAENVEISGNVINTRSTGIALGTITEPVRNIIVRNNTVNTELYTAYSSLATAIGVDGNSSNLTIERNKLQQVGAVADSREAAYPDRFNLIRIGVASAANPANVAIRHNDFSRITQQNYLYVGPGVTNTVTANENWWGSQANPAAKISSVGATVVSDPWLCQSFSLGVIATVDGSCAPPNAAPTLTVATPAEGTAVSTKANDNKLKITGIFKDDVKANYATMQLVKDGTSVAIGTLYGFGSVWNPEATYATADGSYTYNLPVPANLADGDYSLFYIGTDFADGITDRMERKFVIDNTRPEVTLLSPDNNAINPTSYSVKGTDEFGLRTVTAHIYDAANKNLIKNCSTSFDPTDNSERILNCPVPGLADGVYTIRYNATDIAGNTSATKTSKFIIDNTDPTVSIKTGTGAVDGSLGNHPYYRQISFKLHDPKGALKQAELNGNAYVRKNEWNDLNWANINKSHLKQGINTIVVSDQAGNSSELEFIYDSIAPAISVKDDFVGDKSTKVFSKVSFKLSDGIMADKYQINDGAFTDFTNNKNSDANFQNIKSRLVQAEKNTITLYDAAGNSSSYTFTYDSVAPTATISYSPAGPAWTKNNVTVTLTTSEPIQQSALPGTWLKVSETVYKKVYPANAVQDVTLKDIAGNTGVQTVVVSWIDKKAPTAEIVAPDITNDTNPTIKGVGNDDQSGVKSNWFEIKAPNGTLYYVNGKTEFSLSEAKDNTANKNPIVITDGEYQIRYVVTDNAGNRSDDPNLTNHTRKTMVIDSTAPAINITSATPSEIQGTVDADATEVWVKVGSGPEQRATYTPGQTTWTLAINPALTANAAVIARAVDPLNNTNSASTNPMWATGTISVVNTPAINVPVIDNGPSAPTGGQSNQGGSAAILANATPSPQVNSPVADTTDGTGDVAGAATVNKDSEDKGQVLAAEDAKDSWSLINLLLTIGIGVASIISLLGLLGANRKDRKLASRLLTIVPAAGAVVALLLIEDFSGSMIWVNIWSLLIGALAVIQMIILGMSKPTTDE